MKNLPGRDDLKTAFADFAARHAHDDLAGRAARSGAAALAALIESLRAEYPKEWLAATGQDLVDALCKPEFATGFSALVRSFDEKKVESLLNDLAGALKDPHVSVKAAQFIKVALLIVPADTLAKKLDDVLEAMPGQVQFVARSVFWALRPVLDYIAMGTETEGAARLAQLTDEIPVADIAQKIGSVTQGFTPEVVSENVFNLVAALPSMDEGAAWLDARAAAAQQKMSGIAGGGKKPPSLSWH